MKSIIEYKTNGGQTYFFSSLKVACETIPALNYSKLRNAKLPFKGDKGTIFRHPINERKEIADAIKFFKRPELLFTMDGEAFPEEEGSQEITVTFASGKTAYFVNVKTFLSISGSWDSSDPAEDNQTYHYDFDVEELLDVEGSQISDFGELVSLIEKHLSRHGIYRHKN